MSTLTDKLNMSKPADGDISWGDEIRNALDTIDSALISSYFSENVIGHSGLDFAYLSGIYRKGNIIVSIAGDTITLADDTTNYVFINTTTGSVVVNQTGVVLGNIALFEVVTASGAITTVVDVRSLLSADVTVPHTHNNLLDETAHDLLDHTGLTGVGSSNVADFTDLGDVPSSLIGLGGQAIIVKEDETGLETGTPSSTFVSLTDTPVSYVGQSGKIPAVNEDENGLEFINVPSGGSNNDRGICFSINNVDLATTQSVAITAPVDLTITGGKLEVGTAPTDADLICDIHKNGTTLWTTQANRPTIAEAGTSATITAPDVTSIAQGDRLLLMIDQIGSTVAGKDLSLTLYCEVA